MRFDTIPRLASLDCEGNNRLVAYFSMEIAVSPAIPTYSGGLGVLAGDTLRAAADMGLPLAAVTLAHRQGYFRQILDADGNQTAGSQPWSPESILVGEDPVVTVTIEGRPVAIRAWRYDLEGVTGHTIPIYFLDTNLEQNDPRDRVLTDQLYGGDGDYRLRQEAVLGMGGARILAALNFKPLVYHMNEGHAALLTVALVEQQLKGSNLDSATDTDLEAVRQQCVFTTHTPVPAGHDRFSGEQAHRILGDEGSRFLERVGAFHDKLLNMTYLALRFSRFVNGVAMQHGIVSREMFPEYDIEAITNGVHAATWTSPAFQAAFDSHLPRWRQDNLALRYAINIPETVLEEAHLESKRALIAAVKEHSGVELRPELFTLGFARRAATYKRADLLFTEPERLVKIAQKCGGLQILYSGKAHPADEPGKAKIKRVIELSRELSSERLRIVYLENYEWSLGALLTGGVDLWLNTPKRPYEASGTSGMKAALNGVPSLSILDGWWIEGWIEGVTGWAIADHDEDAGEARSLYAHLEAILPLYYKQPEQWRRIMRSTIALNGSYFNTQRMLEQYVQNAYFPETPVQASASALESILAK
ncbi:MAG: alpha-glucan family phosphorylase [Silvibacterium sp.]|nr:alpha-glucan family phosphorylase [Silvibacterium sp.]MBV8436284.1 alpha-glucan family phosphorylase [Silvibacterium sp.]